jgi:hypothetical protein
MKTPEEFEADYEFEVWQTEYNKKMEKEWLAREIYIALDDVQTITREATEKQEKHLTDLKNLLSRLIDLKAKFTKLQTGKFA